MIVSKFLSVTTLRFYTGVNSLPHTVHLMPVTHLFFAYMWNLTNKTNGRRYENKEVVFRGREVGGGRKERSEGDWALNLQLENKWDSSRCLMDEWRDEVWTLIFGFLRPKPYIWVRLELSLIFCCVVVIFQRLKPTNPAAQKALTTPTHYKLTPRPATRVRPKALQTTGTAKSQLFDGLDDDEPSLANGAFMPKWVFVKLSVKY